MRTRLVGAPPLLPSEEGISLNVRAPFRPIRFVLSEARPVSRQLGHFQKVMSSCIYSFVHAFCPQITFVCVHSSNNRCYHCALSKVIDNVNVGWFAVEEQRGAPIVRHSYLISRTGSIYSKQFIRKRAHMKICISGHVMEGFADMFGLKCLRLNLI